MILSGRTSAQSITAIVDAVAAGQAVDFPPPQPLAVTSHCPGTPFSHLISPILIAFYSKPLLKLFYSFNLLPWPLPHSNFPPYFLTL